jgi:Fe-S-cluster-containing dehydrogenase component
MAESYGNTLDATKILNMGQGNTEDMDNLMAELEDGKIDAVLFYNTNPLYNYPENSRFEKALEKAKLTISFATKKDETAAACKYILPDNHYLESWNDAEPQPGIFSLAQPVMQPIFNTRQFQATLLAWQESETDFHQYIKNYWQRNVYPGQTQYPDFNQFWVNTLQKGVYEKPMPGNTQLAISSAAVSEAVAQLKNLTSRAGELEFTVYENVAMADGAYANNPWLQELPDPVTKVTWDNFASVSPIFANEQGLKQGDIIELNGIEMPVLIQPGQAYGTFSVALGYGRSHAGKSGDNVGVNVFPLLKTEIGMISYSGKIEDWSRTGAGYEFAQTQTHHSMEGRHIVRESTLDKYMENPKAGNEIRDYHLKHMVTLYPEHEFPGHHWVLMVDLNACNGCSTCVIACQAENNTPVIGKTEVKRRRIMHWMRIDRYYTGDTENPGVVYQPLMCQHCDNAPCENVCPVSATNHSQEGINQMAYNRCVGTKYCINNCPYKVRRFNWFQYSKNDKFDYNMNSDLGRMVLNPDVTVRERGVVEKCSFCVQRIQEAKLKAKTERRKLRDGDVIPACVGSCPSNALVFGDLNDKNSKVAQLIKDPRNYHLLEELHTLPTVGYLTKIRNKG